MARMHIPLNPSAKLRINTKEHKCFIVSLALFFNFHLNLTNRLYASLGSEFFTEIDSQANALGVGGKKLHVVEIGRAHV